MTDLSTPKEAARASIVANREVRCLRAVGPSVSTRAWPEDAVELSMIGPAIKSVGPGAISLAGGRRSIRTRATSLPVSRTVVTEEVT